MSNTISISPIANPDSTQEPAARQVLGACPHDCPDTCSLLTTVEGGVATRVQGNPEHPHTGGVLCNKVSRYTERTYHPERLLGRSSAAAPRAAGSSSR
jgi:anaerobic selenocysteine-containing dehydrogenase